MEGGSSGGGGTVISPEAPPSYHVAPRHDTNSSLVPVGMSSSSSPPAAAAHLGPSTVGNAGPFGSSEKKKRGRPRKYGPDGASLSPAGGGGGFFPEKMLSAPRPASEKKHRSKIGAENLGDWISCTTGGNFIPHVITVEAGQDVTMKIISFSQQGPRAICIISANGLISNVTLRQPNSSGGTLTYEGRFEILSLSGSFTPTEFSGAGTSRSGGMSISLASPDGRVVGGMLAGLLIAATPVQVVVGSFLPSNQNELKTPSKKPKAESTKPQPVSNSQVSSVDMTAHHHNPNPDPRNPTAMAQVYPGSGWGAMPPNVDDESRKGTTDINISLHSD
ncbi:unnamed protein product [Cuscuta campestris]|uniref:AT-hook motif nuclear-localized protein n=1 Tax=Cuscuta campestris TaxID=132261 RepID=A0A484MQW3_9ASTE|nr:unnamed protein product [Cuscuta campestris]